MRNPNLVRLIPIEKWRDYEIELWHILAQRPQEACISHKEMPNWDDHLKHIRDWPRIGWYFIYCGVSDKAVGAIYLDSERHVGLDVLPEWRRNGFGSAAVYLLRRAHPGPLYANVAPKNERGRKFWEREGGELAQVTYRFAA